MEALGRVRRASAGGLETGVARTSARRGRDTGSARGGVAGGGFVAARGVGGTGVAPGTSPSLVDEVGSVTDPVAKEPEAEAATPTCNI